jgi:enoyl-CoA hydratase/carnithine racemase
MPFSENMLFRRLIHLREFAMGYPIKVAMGALLLAALPASAAIGHRLDPQERMAKALEGRIAEELQIFTERLASPEAKEAMSAFLEKRKPRF